jgi:hypothetical protein
MEQKLELTQQEIAALQKIGLYTTVQRLIKQKKQFKSSHRAELVPTTPARPTTVLQTNFACRLCGSSYSRRYVSYDKQTSRHYRELERSEFDNYEVTETNNYSTKRCLKCREVLSAKTKDQLVELLLTNGK